MLESAHNIEDIVRVFSSLQAYSSVNSALEHISYLLSISCSGFLTIKILLFSSTNITIVSFLLIVPNPKIIAHQVM